MGAPEKLADVLVFPASLPHGLALELAQSLVSACARRVNVCLADVAGDKAAGGLLHGRPAPDAIDLACREVSRARQALDTVEQLLLRIRGDLK